MRISVFGLGYVGTVTAACLAANGHQVIGVDVAADKVDSINGGRSPIGERDIDRIVGEATAAGNLRATTEAGRAIAESELAIICVGTPSSNTSGFDSQYVERVTAEIGAALAGSRKEDLVVALRSTVVRGLPNLVAPILERSLVEPR